MGAHEARLEDGQLAVSFDGETARIELAVGAAAVAGADGWEPLVPGVERILGGPRIALSTPSARPSLPEIGGELANYWHDFEPETMAEVVRQGLDNYDSESLIKYAQKFSWDSCIQQYLELYEAVS